MERPAKKPRLQGPDGFHKSKPTTRYKPPESITKFVSAFNDSVKPPSRPKSPPKKKPVHDLSFVDFGLPEAGPSKPSVPVPKKPASFAKARAVKADKVPTPLKVLKPPVFLPPAAESSNKPSTTFSALLKPLPSPSEKPRSILKPPPVPIPSTKPSAPLKPLPPPPVPEPRPASPEKPLKTIFTTTVAQATDPTKEGAGAELLSLFLLQHGHTFTSPTDRELLRGVMVSPDKHSRGKDPKFTRGGLAERFQHRIACAKTDLVLWRRQVERRLEGKHALGGDAQLRILRVLDVSKPERTRGAVGPRAGLALCRLTRRHPMAGAELAHGTYVVVFQFGQGQGGEVSSAERFEAGNDVMVWMPWHMVDLGESRRLLEMCRTLDALTPPRSLLVVSRFCIIVPKLPRPCDLP